VERRTLPRSNGWARNGTGTSKRAKNGPVVTSDGPGGRATPDGAPDGAVGVVDGSLDRAVVLVCGSPDGSVVVFFVLVVDGANGLVVSDGKAVGDQSGDEAVGPVVLVLSGNGTGTAGDGTANGGGGADGGVVFDAADRLDAPGDVAFDAAVDVEWGGARAPAAAAG
jgi:hypothetical protein